MQLQLLLARKVKAAAEAEQVQGKQQLPCAPQPAGCLLQAASTLIATLEAAWPFLACMNKRGAKHTCSATPECQLAFLDGVLLMSITCAGS